MTQSDPTPDVDDPRYLARKLVGNVVRFRHWPAGGGVALCTKMHVNGGVELEGMPGIYAPHLFELEGETVAVPVLGKVS